MIRQFDVKKNDANVVLDMGKREHKFNELVGSENDGENGELDGVEGEGAEVIDDDEGWINEIELLTAEEHKALDETIQLLKLVLVKVYDIFLPYLHANLSIQLCKLTSKIVNSSTILLPAWKSMLEELKQMISIMLHNIITWWNLTYDLLEYALKHQRAMDKMTQDQALDLRKFDLGDHEWELIEQLRNMLKVSQCLKKAAW